MGLRLRSDGLARDLRRQKEIAEHANVAKSMFLAAASHDLRQPVHALGLYVGALRGQPMTGDGESLVDRIESSIRAMDQLFSALLDLSQLDAGIVEVSRRPFAARSFLERVCRDYVAPARAKGLALDVVASGALIDTDPVLMERILRNLISNAVRYTDRGRILVGCRKRGARLRAAGLGHRARHRRRPARGRSSRNITRSAIPSATARRGSGSASPSCAASPCCSTANWRCAREPGKGSCFEVDGAARARRRGRARGAGRRGGLGSRRRGLVVVVDDEEPIREAMARLLGGWGYETWSPAPATEMLRALARRADAPALILCDYRLRDGETGVDVVERLRMRI